MNPAIKSNENKENKGSDPFNVDPFNVNKSQSRKKPTNVSVNIDLLSKAKSLNINLSATLEQALIAKMQEYEREQWRQENADAIQAYNDFVEQRGLFSDSVRKF